MTRLGKRTRTIFVAVVGMVLLAGCATSGPYLQTAADRQAYATLVPNMRQLVDRGQIEKGMDPETVRLSWGNPAVQIPIPGQSPAEDSMRWEYYGSRWVNVPRWVYVYDRYGGYMLDFRMDRQVERYVRAVVIFEKGKVTTWRTYPPE